MCTFYVYCTACFCVVVDMRMCSYECLKQCHCHTNQTCFLTNAFCPILDYCPWVVVPYGTYQYHRCRVGQMPLVFEILCLIARLWSLRPILVIFWMHNKALKLLQILQSAYHKNLSHNHCSTLSFPSHVARTWFNDNTLP